jgi:Holliday junction DNA helicase RuvA
LIVGLRGKVLHKEPTLVHIEAYGVIYEVFISLQSYSAIRDGEVLLHTTHIIREDADLLYGFLEKDEKFLFENLLKINGVGPKVATAICSTYTPSQFATIISAKDIKAMQQIPGIGPKSAGRILVELSGFDEKILASSEPSSSKIFEEATLALETLGFKKDKISKVLAKCKSQTTPELVKEALKLLQTN